MKRIFAFVLILTVIALLNSLESPAIAKAAPRDALDGLRKEHPRIILTPQRLQSVKTLAESDPILAAMLDQVKQDAETKLTQPTIEYRIPDGKRLLAQSRLAINRIWSFSLAYRLTGDRRFLDAAVKEMHVAAGFKDWNPSHFLDTAEMTAALAVGYDWLYNDINPKDRETIRQAIIRLGLMPGFDCFAGKSRSSWWPRASNNWNQVCNGGMILGSLAIADEKPELAKRMIGHCLKSIPNGLKEYRPDGSYPEGPGYWTYGTCYTVLTILALDSALGHDFGIHEHEGLDLTAKYRLHMVGPTKYFFNYADGGVTARPSATIFGLAHIFRQPDIARLHLESLIDCYRLDREDKKPLRERFYPLNVIYYPENKKMIASEKSQLVLPLDAFFRGRQDVVTMRGSWNDSNATFLGIKGGDNQASHGHLDIGSFVLDASSVRWAIDLGSDNYNMPGYFSKKSRRWKYYRMTNLSHNTLVIGGQLQNIKAVSKVTDFQTKPKATHATIDMSDAYKGQAESVVRKASLLDRKKVVIEDVVTAAVDDVRWGMVTKAKITLDGPRAILTKAGHTMNVEIVSPKNARFEILSTRPKTDIENQNKGTRMLAFKTKPDANKKMVLKVVFSPVE
ncbi:MAG: heparinase II/III family protein [Pirellulales bacterium]|nr:heparinase II/III family protein [Pirellulales bacterium]